MSHLRPNLRLHDLELQETRKEKLYLANLTLGTQLASQRNLLVKTTAPMAICRVFTMLGLLFRAVNFSEKVQLENMP